MVILVITIIVAGVLSAQNLIKKSRILAAQTLTQSSPIDGIKDLSLWLESSIEKSFADGSTYDGHAITKWNDIEISTNKVTISAVGTGATYANTINYIPAVAFDGTSSNYLQISDASFINNTDYTITILEKRKSNASDNYFIGDSPTGTANQKLALGYSLNGQIIHAQGTNSYTANVSAYSSGKPRIFTFVSDSTSGKQMYVDGVLVKTSADTTKLSGITSLAIGKSYNGEIGEIAIFSRALKTEERQSVEDYISKKWSSKLLRDQVENGSCTNGTLTDSKCDLDCSTASFPGVSSPSSVPNAQTVSATCGQTGYDGSTISLTCSNGSLSGGSCGCQSPAYEASGSSCVAVPQCAVNVAGVSSHSPVYRGTGNFTCNATNYNGGTIGYTCNSSGNLTTSTACSCATGYNPATSCTTCVAGYTMISGTCQQDCVVPNGTTGITNGTTVPKGSTSFACNANGYTGSINYSTCAGGGATISVSSNTCVTACNISGLTPTTYNGKNVFTVTSGPKTFSCTTTTNVQVLVVGGGGGGGSASNGPSAGGGGGGGVVYASSYPITANTTYNITIGAGGSGSGSSYCVGATGGDSTFGNVNGTITAKGGGGGGTGYGYAQTSCSGTKNATNAGSGGSGGGGANNGGSIAAAGSSTQTSQTNATAFYGNAGGTVPAPCNTNGMSGRCGGAGGGGAGAAGSNATNFNGANGGAGIQISAISTNYFGGGGGGSRVHEDATGSNSSYSAGSGGIGGGGAGGSDPVLNGTAGTANTGGGGGSGASGGSGVVIIAF